MKYYSLPVANFARPIVILGPTTVGKTDVAFSLAQRDDAEVINADKFYLYDSIPEATGQSDANQYGDVRSHLYGVLKPDAPRWTSAQYAGMVERSVQDCRAQRRQVVVEGCSFEFISAAIKVLTAVAKRPDEIPLLVGLSWMNRDKIADDCARRAEGMIANGMAGQYRSALGRGEGETFVMKKCFAREPLLSFGRGDLTRLQLRHRVAAELQRHAERHYAKLSRIPNVTWIDHDRGNVEATIQQILALRQRTATRVLFKELTPGLLVDFEEPTMSDFTPAITFATAGATTP